MPSKPWTEIKKWERGTTASRAKEIPVDSADDTAKGFNPPISSRKSCTSILSNFYLECLGVPKCSAAGQSPFPVMGQAGNQFTRREIKKTKQEVSVSRATAKKISMDATVAAVISSWIVLF